MRQYLRTINASKLIEQLAKMISQYGNMPVHFYVGKKPDGLEDLEDTHQYVTSTIIATGNNPHRIWSNRFIIFADSVELGDEDI